MTGQPSEMDEAVEPRTPVERSWLEVRAHQARNPPPPVFRAVVANLVLAIAGAVLLVLVDRFLIAPAERDGLGVALVAVYVVVVLVVGSVLTYLWVELPSGASGVHRRSPWSALLGFFAAVPIVYLVLVVALQVVRPLLG